MVLCQFLRLNNDCRLLGGYFVLDGFTGFSVFLFGGSEFRLGFSGDDCVLGGGCRIDSGNDDWCRGNNTGLGVRTPSYSVDNRWLHVLDGCGDCLNDWWCHLWFFGGRCVVEQSSEEVSAQQTEWTSIVSGSIVVFIVIGAQSQDVVVIVIGGLVFGSLVILGIVVFTNNYVCFRTI